MLVWSRCKRESSRQKSGRDKTLWQYFTILNSKKRKDTRIESNIRHKFSLSVMTMDYKPTKDGIKSYIGVRQKSLHSPLDELIYKERNNYWALLLLQKYWGQFTQVFIRTLSEFGECELLRSLVLGGHRHNGGKFGEEGDSRTPIELPMGQASIWFKQQKESNYWINTLPYLSNNYKTERMDWERDKKDGGRG